MEGQGTMRWKTSRLPKSDEEEYVGEWRAGLQHGSGVSTVYDHRGRKKLSYEGEWCEGLRHGGGREMSAAGIVLREGAWSRGVFLDEKEPGTTAKDLPGSLTQSKGELTHKKSAKKQKSRNTDESQRSVTPEKSRKEKVSRKAKNRESAE